MNSLGEIIKDRRLGKGWSKRALAEKASISHSEVHRIETGERANPSVPVLNSLAEALGIPKEDLLLVAGYKNDDGGIPMIMRVFPELKTEKQQQTAQKIIDWLARSSNMDDIDYDRLVEQMEMFFNYVKKKHDNK